MSAIYKLGVLILVLITCVSAGFFQDVRSAWTCPIHREVTEGSAGICGQCGSELITIDVEQAYSCPIHAVVSAPDPGKCPICQRELFLITKEVQYSCPMHPEVQGSEPGICDICSMSLERRSLSRPHQDHNPKHGGMFFMAPDNWHHLEGTYPMEGVFRIFLYDNFSEPMQVERFRGRAVLEESFDPASKQTDELLAYPLRPSSDGSFLEAKVGTVSLPLEITAKIQFEDGGIFERFDFVFQEVSLDVNLDLALPTVSPQQFIIPLATVDIVAAIVDRDKTVRELIESGRLAEVYLPALQAKDLALALEPRMEIHDRDRGAVARWALKQLVRSAWLLDDYGDMGNRTKIEETYVLFSESVRRIDDVFHE